MYVNYSRTKPPSELQNMHIFGEDMRNASGNRLLSFLNEVKLMICNGRKLVSGPEWTRVKPSLKQKSIIDFIITDAQLLEVSGNVHVDHHFNFIQCLISDNKLMI